LGKISDGRAGEGGTTLKIDPLTPDRWDDFETLFGARGACGGCWCMTPRLTRSEYERQKGEPNRQAMKAIVQAGEVPGVLGYLHQSAVGWCCIGSRETFSSLARSRILKPIDSQPVWSIVCFFVAKEYRRQGVSEALITGAVRYARTQGARIVEAFPVEPRKVPMPPVFAYTGIASAFLAAGFEEVARRSETRPILRRALR
jgi:GNAT superfamily N-acetyltransferase